MDYMELVGALPDGVAYRFGESLSRHTGFRTGGLADVMVWPDSRDAFLHTMATVRRLGLPYYLLGNGSNVLAPDEGYHGVVIKTDRALTALERQGDTVRCGAGVSLARLCVFLAERGLSGMEFAYGIPGSVGGALYMNAGAYGGEMKDVVVSAEILDKEGTVTELSAPDLALGYRTSALGAMQAAALSVTLRTTPDDKAAILARMEELMQRRRDKQPLELPSCGSTFKRPEGAYAAELIERCGLKGFSVGGAAVSKKHSGFVVNTGGATSDDVLAVAHEVRRIVREQTGYDLKLEIQLMK